MKYQMMTGAALTALAFAPAWAAQAQTADSTTKSEAATLDTARAAPTAEVSEVIVTGSLISRRDYSAESPISTIGAETLQNGGPQTIAEVFNKLPQFAAIRPGTTTDQSRQGRQAANLRGLGITRTLVLLDGRRMQPSDKLGSVDLNTIPKSLIESVEVITGGASAVYGSDAIAGVVNVKLRHDFDGIQVDGSYGIASRGDAQSKGLDLTWGGKINDGRGTILLSAGYLSQDGARKGALPFFRNAIFGSLTPAAWALPTASNQPSQAAINAVFGKYGVTSTVARNATFGVNPDGTLYTTAAPVVNFRFPDGSDTQIQSGRVVTPIGPGQYRQSPLERYNLFGRATYDLTNDIEAYAQFSHVQFKVTTGPATSNARNFSVSPSNPFIPDDLRTLLRSRPNPDAPFLIGLQLIRIEPSLSENEYAVDQYIGGLRGTLPIKDWKWDAYASYGRTQQNTATGNAIDLANFSALLNAPDGGKSLCSGGFNPFISTTMSADPAQQACHDFLDRTTLEAVTLQQSIVQGTLQGGLFDIPGPGGEVRFALGADYRKNTYNDRPSPNIVTDNTLTSGIWVSPAYAVPVNPISGSLSVKEAFAEVAVPILENLPLIKLLEADLAYRISDYGQPLGSIARTYKATGTWKVFDWLSFRGGYQKAIRAPSIGELFFPRGSSSTTVIGQTGGGGGDPCDFRSLARSASNPDAAKVRALCVALGVPASVIDVFRFDAGGVSAVVPEGAQNVDEELARTYTIGGVVRSPWNNPLLSSLTASIDYYDISVDGAIGTVTPQIALQKCTNQSGGNPDYSANNIFCQQIKRDANGNLVSVNSPPLNLAVYKVSGVDVEADWGASLEDLGLSAQGRLSARIIVSYLGTYAIQNFAGDPLANYAGTIGNGQIDLNTLSYPKWKISGTLNYDRGPLGISLQGRWIDSMSHFQDVGQAVKARPGVASRYYLDLNASWAFANGAEVHVGVQNLMDKMPPVWTGEGATDPSLYDIMGRRFTVGFTKRM